MNLYAVRGKVNREMYLDHNGLLVEAFCRARLFTLLDDARKEVAKYPSWREVIRVRWELQDEEVSAGPGIGPVFSRPRLVRFMRVVQ